MVVSVLYKDLVAVFTSKRKGSIGIPPFILAAYRTELFLPLFFGVRNFCSTLFAVALGIRMDFISCNEGLNRTEGHINEGGYVL